MLVMVLWSTRILNLPTHEVFGQLYFSGGWQAVFAIDRSFLIWASLFGLAMLLRAFAGSGFLHIATDFLTPHDDARRQFWPTNDWVFRSPISYWDERYYGGLFAPWSCHVFVPLRVLV